MKASFTALREKLKNLPLDPGVYMMKDARGQIIYVGKAKILKNRVSSYFVNPNQLTVKTAALQKEIVDFEIILTQTEVEALLLERTLIKHHKPRFNILLRDDKEYPYLRIDLNAPWPRIEKVRRRKDDGADYLGPYGSASFLRLMLDATYKIFPLIRCTPYEFANARRPCNYYHMKQCLGPCTLPVSRDDYVAMIKNAMSFLQGKNRELLRDLKQKMQFASDQERYEDAAVYRDQIKAFEKLSEKQVVVVADVPDADVIGIADDERHIAFNILVIRDGKMMGADSFVVEMNLDDMTGNLAQFLLQYYEKRQVAPELIVPYDVPDMDALLSTIMGNEHGQKVKIYAPQRGIRHDLLNMAIKNARYAIEEVTREHSRGTTQLEALRKRLHLARLPERIECIDISNLQGQAIVASDVCFIDGKPAKEYYRHYTIETITNGPDDFGSIREVVTRRLRRAVDMDDLPDLLVIDGGRGQLSAALDAAALFPQLKLTIIGLAKSRIEKKQQLGKAIDTSDPTYSYERIFLAGEENATPLIPGTPEFRILTHIRDEAHRFAITHHRKKRSKIVISSILDQVPGIGPKLKKRLLERFGSIEKIRDASLEQLLQTDGLSEKVAISLIATLNGDAETTEPNK